MRIFSLILLGLFGANSGLAQQSAITFNNCNELPVCLPFNNCTAAPGTFTIEASTFCANQTIGYSHKIDFGNNGTVDVDQQGAAMSQNFPIGQSKITWRATNQCGGAATCNQIVTVKDCSPPNLLCRNGVTQNLDNNCMITLSAQQYVLSISDNCTPNNQLVYGLRRAGQGTGFPAADTIQLRNCSVGTNIVEVWVKDALGNANQCANYVIVQNNDNLCPCINSTDLKLKCCMRTYGNKKMTAYRINAVAKGTAGSNAAPVNLTKTYNVTDSCYTADMTLPVNFTGTIQVKASRNDIVTNEVSAYDLILISRHILNLEPMTTMYQTLAADVNRSKTISTFDIIEIRKTLLATIDTFPAVGAWQFVRPIADTANLVGFAAVKDSFMINLTKASGPVNLNNLHFIAIKSGDVDRSANFTDGLDERGMPLALVAEDIWLEAGQTATMPLHFSEHAMLSGYQMAFQPEQGKAQIIGFEQVAQQAQSVLSNGTARVLWLDDEQQIGNTRAFAPEAPALGMQVRALESGWLSHLIAQDTSMVAEAINENVQARPLQLVFKQPKVKNTQVFQPMPNPFDGEISWPVLLQEDQNVRLTLVNAAGQMVYHAQAFLPAGQHQLGANLGELPAGWYGWRVTVGTEVAVGKVVRR